MPTLAEQIAQLEDAINAQEKLRPMLGDTTVNAATTAVRAKLEALRAQQLETSSIDRTILNAQLQRLEEAGLIRLFTQYPEVDYIFKHALTQDAAYESLLLSERKELHCKVGEVLELIYADQLSPFYGIIAEHFRCGEAWQKAFDYLSKAGDAASRLYANAEARLQYARAIEALRPLPDSEDNRRRRMDTLIKQVSVSYLADPPELSFARLAEAESLGNQLPGLDGSPGDRLRLARVHYWRGRVHVYRNETHEAIASLRQVLAVAQEFHDEELLAFPSSVIGRALNLQGHFANAGQLLAQAVAPLEKAGNWPEWVFTVVHLGLSLAARGHYAAGLAEGQRALARAQETHHLTSIAQSYSVLSLISYMGGDMPSMLEAGRAVVDAAEQAGDRLFVYLGHGIRAWAESRLGQHERAFESLTRARTIAQSIGTQLVVSDWFAAVSAEMALSAGKIKEALTLAEQAVGVTQASGGIFADGLAQRVWGQALSRVSPPQWVEAEHHLAESLRLFEVGEARLEAARTHIAWGLIDRERGDTLAAREHFEKAASQFEASGLTRELAQTRALLAEIVGI